ncbi:MAG TPA: divergent PAP2 family protein, partial [Firmicutes bacterium]|nr:divergent PAP2 family protein [Bacillota bacterium]
YDAAGVRRAAGKQAQILNQIVDDLYHGGRVREDRLKELLGHTPVEVFAGAILGILVAIALAALRARP